MSEPSVVSVSIDGAHRFSKLPADTITLVAGIGVQGDAHAGITVQHRSRVAADPNQPNLRQVHLLAAELLDELRQDGFDVRPGQLGENITTRGVPLLDLPRGSLLRLGDHAVVRVTGLRNPCGQINDFRPGLLKRVVGAAPDGTVIRRAGVMGVVLTGGAVAPQDPIAVELPEGSHHRLEPV